MSLTAREWLLLPKSEQEKRGKELSPEECLKLRIELSEIHFSEEEKSAMSEQQKYNFVNSKQYTIKEREEFNLRTQAIFKKMQKEVEEQKGASDGRRK